MPQNRFKGDENLKGRPMGITNKDTLEARKFAREIVESREYRESVKRRIRNDKLAPAVETTLMHYAWGKPKETLVVERPEGGDVTRQTEEELAMRAARISRELLEPLPDPPAEAESEPRQLPDGEPEVVEGRVVVPGYDYINVPKADNGQNGQAHD